METGRTALLVFFAMFWTSVMFSVSRYRPFDTTAIFSSSGEDRRRAIFRISICCFILNIVPILWLWFLYKEIIPDKTGWFPIMAAAFASLSVFGFNRILHAIIATSKTHSIFYSDHEWPEIMKKLPYRSCSDPANSIRAHLIPGLCYLSIPTLMGRIIGFPHWRVWFCIGLCGLVVVFLNLSGIQTLVVKCILSFKKIPKRLSVSL